ncbi:hypothetical protein Cflav_PD6250 [Pedosphaera parvula Ellin514]|uniref:Uncharacterized protein n=1 Tax=Pedosphaera parvula (strain Ellin514) TaxID=320771 RepID=B9XHT1_PEDPL|nr:hypothetical protein Cflav_PD6250 [Pedosphaera parvula Ellin514]
MNMFRREMGCGLCLMQKVFEERALPRDDSFMNTIFLASTGGAI